MLFGLCVDRRGREDTGGTCADPMTSLHTVRQGSYLPLNYEVMRDSASRMDWACGGSCCCVLGTYVSQARDAQCLVTSVTRTSIWRRNSETAIIYTNFMSVLIPIFNISGKD